MNAIKKIVMGLAVVCAATVLSAMGDDVAISAAGKIKVTVAAGLVAQSTPVYLMWDTEDKGDDSAAWAHSAKIGDVDAAGGEFNVAGAAYSIPNGAAIRAFVGAPEVIELYESLTKAAGAQAIVSTGYVPSSATKKVEFDFSYTTDQTVSGNWLFGSSFIYSDGTVTRIGASRGSTASTIYCYGHDKVASSTASQLIGISNASRGVVTLQMGEYAKWQSSTKTVIGAGVALHTSLNRTLPLPLCVFGYNNYMEATLEVSTNVFGNGVLTVYGLKTYESTKVADYVPAKKDGAFGLYDELSRKFCPAEGDDATTGFTAGAKMKEVFLFDDDVIVSAAATYDAVAVISAAGKIKVTVAAGLVTRSTPVYLVWDTEDKGDDSAAWAHSAKIGDVDAAGGEFPTKGRVHGIADGAAIRAFVGALEVIELYESLTKAENAVAYVNTGYKPNTKTKKLALEFKYTNDGETSGNNWLMGILYRNNGTVVEKTGFSRNSSYPTTVYTYWGASANGQISDGPYSTRNTLALTLGEKATWGSKTDSKAMAAAYTCNFPCPLHLFGNADYEASTGVSTPIPFNRGDMTVYSLQIYATNVSTKVADYVPAKKDDAFGLYEKLSGTFYPAEGADAATGFTAGEKTGEDVPIPSAAATYRCSGLLLFLR